MFVRLVGGVVSVVDGIELDDVLCFKAVRFCFAVRCFKKVRVELVPSDLLDCFSDLLTAVLASVESVFGIDGLSNVHFAVAIVRKDVDVIGFLCCFFHIVLFHIVWDGIVRTY